MFGTQCRPGILDAKAGHGMSRHPVSASVGAASVSSGEWRFPPRNRALLTPTHHPVETRAPPCWPGPHLAATGTARSKLVLIAGHAVVSTLVGHERTGAQWLLTAAAQEAVLVPCLASVLQLPGPCGEQGSHSEAVCQAPECHPLLWPYPQENPHCFHSSGKVVSMHMQQGPHHTYCTCEPLPNTGPVGHAHARPP